jgi:hypothetical protein
MAKEELVQPSGIDVGSGVGPGSFWQTLADIKQEHGLLPQYQQATAFWTAFDQQVQGTMTFLAEVLSLQSRSSLFDGEAAKLFFRRMNAAQTSNLKYAQADIPGAKRALDDLSFQLESVYQQAEGLYMQVPGVPDGQEPVPAAQEEGMASLRTELQDAFARARDALNSLPEEPWTGPGTMPDNGASTLPDQIVVPTSQMDKTANSFKDETNSPPLPTDPVFQPGPLSAEMATVEQRKHDAATKFSYDRRQGMATTEATLRGFLNNLHAAHKRSVQELMSLLQ